MTTNIQKHQFRIVIYSMFVPSDILCVLQKKQTSMQHLSNNRLPIAALAAPSQMDLSFNLASFWREIGFQFGAKLPPGSPKADTKTDAKKQALFGWPPD